MPTSIRSERLLTADSKRHALADEVRFHKDFMAHTLHAGYDNFLVGELPSSAGVKLSQAAKLTSLQPFMLNALDMNFVSRECPVFSKLKVSTAPFHWSIAKPAHTIYLDEAPASASPNIYSAFLVELLAMNNMSFGCCIPTHSCGGRRGFVILTSPADPGPNQMHAVIVKCLHLYDGLAGVLERAGGKPEFGLNKREIECLYWSAEGKSSSEISTIISLSEHTVNHYLIACCRKLDAVNRVQAVAKAVRHGLI
jgi:LuxR family transcriptional regulator, quorum-sensing system regulator BjaR1